MATSEGLTRENHAPMLNPFRDFLARTSWVSRMETGNFPAARSLWRAAGIPSASTMPDVVLPWHPAL